MNEMDINKFRESNGLLVTSFKAIAKENPSYLPMVLTDFNLLIVLSDLDEKLSKSYSMYLNNKNRVLLDPSSSGLQSALMQLYGAELLENYILYQTFNNIALDRGLEISMKSNIKDIENIYLLDGAKILKKRK